MFSFVRCFLQKKLQRHTIKDKVHKCFGLNLTN